MGVKYLLDTHVLLWLYAEPQRVPDRVRSALSDTENELVVSAVSALEVATKVRLGKLDAPGLLDSWVRRTEQIGAALLPIGTGHALLAGRMEWPHRDPFDRLLIAQATIEGLVLVTVDPALRALPTPPVLTW